MLMREHISVLVTGGSGNIPGVPVGSPGVKTLLPPRRKTPIRGGALIMFKDPNLMGVSPPGKRVTLAVKCPASAFFMHFFFFLYGYQKG